MPPLIRLAAVSKSYGGVPALTEADLTCDAGLVHAILGENGAGKSTLMKLLAGVIQPNAGTIELDGRPTAFASPRDAARRGIVCMFQELSLMPHLSVGDNMALATPATGWGLVGKDSYRLARAALDRIGAGHIALSTSVAELSLSERQLVEIAKAIIRKPRLLILDEATSALTSEIVETVFRVVRELKAEGVAILFISHRMHEVDAIADRISVFRNGRHIETFPAGAKTHEQIVSLMIGQSLKELFPARGAPVPETVAPLLRLRDVSWNEQLDAVDLAVRPGEIIGLGGLDGQGQQQAMHAIFGVLNRVSGTIDLAGRSIAAVTPNKAKAAHLGIALVPEDRKTEGLVLDMSIADNLRLAALSRLPLGMLARGGAMDAKLAALIDRLALTFGKLSDPVGTLSGGNQQKVVLAKWLALSPTCLLLMDPTRGIDVKTKAQIYRLLKELAAEGLAIILQSTDYEELIHLCDRVYVFYRGRVNRELTGEALTADSLIAASMNLPIAARSA
jgi:ribose transport system ATP-binding protein